LTVRFVKVSVGLALAALFGAPAVAAAAAGYPGPSFTASSVFKPSGQKPQSKLWFNDGSWWGSLFVPGVEEYRVHRLDPLAHTWIDTGTPLDARNSSEGDVLWDGSHLYVASGSDEVGSPDATRITILRLSYDAAARRYVRDAGYQPVLPGGPVEAVVLDKDSTGRLWLTYTRGNTVFVAHTNGAPDDVWGAPYPLPVTDAANLNPDDISAVVAYAGRIGVMWSNQNAQAMYFASHDDCAPDSAWTLTTGLSGPFSADDHINLKSVQADAAGRVFAAVKTSNSDKTPQSLTDDQVDLLQFAGGAWTRYVFGTVLDDHTRPIVLTDQTTRKLYVFATSPTVETAGPAQTIFYKETSLDAPAFAPGAGTAFIQGTMNEDINDATSTKQDLSVASDLVVLAGDATRYWHNQFALAHAASPTTPSAPRTCPSPPPPPPPSPPAPAADRAAPKLTGLSVRPRNFRTRRRAGRPAGTTVRFKLSEAATVRLGLERRTTGRRVGGGCVRQTRSNRSRRSCVRYVVVRGVVARSLAAGAVSVRFNGRLGGKRVATGRYRLVLVATDAAGNASPARRAAVRILR
jgi:hypothetical protein